MMYLFLFSKVVFTALYRKRLDVCIDIITSVSYTNPSDTSHKWYDGGVSGHEQSGKHSCKRTKNSKLCFVTLEYNVFYAVPFMYTVLFHQNRAYQITNFGKVM